MKQLDRPWKRAIKKRLNENLILKKITQLDHRIITKDLIAATGEKDFDEMMFLNYKLHIVDLKSLYHLGYCVVLPVIKKNIICA